MNHTRLQAIAEIPFSWKKRKTMISLSKKHFQECIWGMKQYTCESRLGHFTLEHGSAHGVSLPCLCGGHLPERFMSHWSKRAMKHSHTLFSVDHFCFISSAGWDKAFKPSSRKGYHPKMLGAKLSLEREELLGPVHSPAMKAQSNPVGVIWATLPWTMDQLHCFNKV